MSYPMIFAIDSWQNTTQSQFTHGFYKTMDDALEGYEALMESIGSEYEEEDDWVHHPANTFKDFKRTGSMLVLYSIKLGFTNEWFDQSAGDYDHVMWANKNPHMNVIKFCEI